MWSRAPKASELGTFSDQKNLKKKSKKELLDAFWSSGGS
jgi:hypothetical protein